MKVDWEALLIPNTPTHRNQGCSRRMLLVEWLNRPVPTGGSRPSRLSANQNQLKFHYCDVLDPQLNKTKSGQLTRKKFATVKS